MSITILTSGSGLGVYLPGLMIQQQLEALGIAADVEVFESCYTDAALVERGRMLSAFQQSFALAQLASKMPASIASPFCADAVGHLLDRWRGKTHFVVWSGFWLDVLVQHEAREGPLHIDLCRIDAIVSASFKGTSVGNKSEIWLWRKDKIALEHAILGSQPPTPWHGRRHRLVSHGGGWSLGSFVDEAARLAQHYEVELLLGNISDAPELPANIRAWRTTPNWQPWNLDANGQQQLPPMIDATGVQHPASLREALLASSLAIVCKPGGGSLIDSLNFATPLVLLPAFSEAETANAEVWIALGFGISLADWQQSRYDPNVLQRLHENLLASRDKPVSYVTSLAQRLAQQNKKH